MAFYINSNLVLLLLAARTEDRVSMSDLKAFVRDRLAPTSPLRQIILSEPDYIPMDEALTKAKVYVKLLYQEFRK